MSRSVRRYAYRLSLSADHTDGFTRTDFFAVLINRFLMSVIQTKLVLRKAINQSRIMFRKKAGPYQPTCNYNRTGKNLFCLEFQESRLRKLYGHFAKHDNERVGFMNVCALNFHFSLPLVGTFFVFSAVCNRYIYF